MQLIMKIFSNFRGVLIEPAIIVLTKEVALGVPECKSHWSRYATPSIKNHSVYKFLQIFRNFLFISKEDCVQSIKPISFCGFICWALFSFEFFNMVPIAIQTIKPNQWFECKHYHSESYWISIFVENESGSTAVFSSISS